MSTGFKVDVAALEALAGRLEAIGSGFDDVDDRADFDAGTLGDDGLADRLGSFGSQWRDGRKSIKGQVDELAKLLRQMARNYQDADDNVRKQIPGGGSTTPVPPADGGGGGSHAPGGVGVPPAPVMPVPSPVGPGGGGGTPPMPPPPTFGPAPVPPPSAPTFDPIPFPPVVGPFDPPVRRPLPPVCRFPPRPPEHTIEEQRRRVSERLATLRQQLASTTDPEAREVLQAEIRWLEEQQQLLGSFGPGVLPPWSVYDPAPPGCIIEMPDPPVPGQPVIVVVCGPHDPMGDFASPGHPLTRGLREASGGVGATGPAPAVIGWRDYGGGGHPVDRGAANLHGFLRDLNEGGIASDDVRVVAAPGALPIVEAAVDRGVPAASLIALDPDLGPGDVHTVGVPSSPGASGAAVSAPRADQAGGGQPPFFLVSAAMSMSSMAAMATGRQGGTGEERPR